MKVLLLMLVVCAVSWGQIVPIAQHDRFVSVETPAAGTLQIAFGGERLVESEGGWTVFGYWAGQERDQSSLDLSLRYGLLDRLEFGLRVDYFWTVDRTFEIPPGESFRSYPTSAGIERVPIALSFGAKMRLCDELGIRPAIAIRTTVALRDRSRDPMYHSTTSVGGEADLAFRNTIGDMVELGYGIGVDGIGRSGDDPGEQGHYWIGLLLPIDERFQIGPSLSGEYAPDVFRFQSFRQWYGASVRFEGESWPVIQVSGRVSSGFEDDLCYNVSIGTAFLAFRM